MKPFRAWMVVSLGASVAQAQAPCAQWSPQFSAGGFDGPAHSLVPWNDGSGPALLAVGNFTGAGEVTAARVASWNGTRWSTFGSGFDGVTDCAAVFDDGNGPEVYVGGLYDHAGGISAHNIARWNGSQWSPLGLGTTARVLAFSVFDDGSGPALYVGGNFKYAGNLLVDNVAFWRDGAWHTAGALPSSASVKAFAIHDDGAGPALYAGGAFTGGVAKLVGGTWVTVGAGVPADVHALASFDDGTNGRRLIASGSLVPGLVGVTAWDGASWLDLGLTGTGLATELAVDAASNPPALYVGGGFTATTPLAVNRFARFDVGGWSPGAAPGPDDGVTSLVMFDAGAGAELYAGGDFHTIGGGDTEHIARFDGVKWNPLPTPNHAIDVTPGYVRALAQWRDPVQHRDFLVAGGGFDSTSDGPALGVARWNGVTWSPLDSGLGGTVDWLNVLAAPGADELLALGPISIPGDPGSGSLARFDGAAWTWIHGAPPPNQVRATVVWRAPGETRDSLVIGGTFTLSLGGGGVADHIARWDGTQWLDVGGSTDGTVYELEVFDPPGAEPEGLYVFGNFQHAGSLAVTKLAKWDGTSWSTVPGPLPGPFDLFDTCVYDDGLGGGEKLFVSSDVGVKRFNGSTWTNYGMPPSFLDPAQIVGFDDGSGPALYSNFGERLRNGHWEVYGFGTADGTQYAMIPWREESGEISAIYHGGRFRSVGGVPARGVARYSNPCARLASYCTAKTNSLGCVPAIGWSGEPSLAAMATTPFVIEASNVLNQKSGILFYGVHGRTDVAFQGGTLCVRSPVHRTPVRSSNGNLAVDDCSGLYSIDFTAWLTGVEDPSIEAGVIVDSQWWSRDPASASTTGLSDALELEVRP